MSLARGGGVGRAALVGKGDAELMAPWALKRGDHVIFTMPKAPCGDRS